MRSRSWSKCAGLLLALALAAFAGAIAIGEENAEEQPARWEVLPTPPQVTVAGDGTLTYQWVLYPPPAHQGTDRLDAALALAIGDLETARGQVLVQQLWQTQGWQDQYPQALEWLTTREYDAFLNWSQTPPTPHLLARRREAEWQIKSFLPAAPLEQIVGRLLAGSGLEKADQVGPGFVYALGDGHVPVTPSVCLKYKKMERRARPVKPEGTQSSLQTLDNIRIHVRACRPISGGASYPEVSLTGQAPGEITLAPKPGWERLGALVAMGENVRWFVGVNYDLSGGFGIAAGYGEFVREVGGTEDTVGRLGFATYGTIAAISELFK